MKYYIIANWKMNMNVTSIDEWFHGYASAAMEMSLGKEYLKQITLILAPSFVHIDRVKDYAKSFGFATSAQDTSYLEKGAHTGFIGAFQLKDYCTYCIVGHSERGEPVEEVLKKRDACISNGITPIVCFREYKEVSKYYTDKALVAWEDPDNISVNGVYREKDPKDIVVAFDFMRKTLPSDAVIIYGGSVNNKNAKDLKLIKGLNGVLIGNASLDPKHFLEVSREFFGSNL